MSGTRFFPQMDVTGGVQDATNSSLRQQKELSDMRNGRLNVEIGSMTRRNGCVVSGDPFATGSQKTPTGGFVAKFTTGAKRFVAVNNSGATATIIRVQNSDGTWTTLSSVTGLPANARVFFYLDNDEVFLTGYNATTLDPITPYNIDNTLDVSTSRNIMYMPAGHFIQEFNGSLWCGNVTVSGTRYPDRIYKSSGRLGRITFIQTDQTDVEVSQTYVDNVPTMTAASSPAGVADASTQWNSDDSFAPWRAFNDSYATRGFDMWHTASGNPTGWLRYDFGSGNSKVITHYSIIAYATDALVGEVFQAPKTWTFEGSTNGTTWVVLDTQTNVSNFSKGEKRRYATANATAYRYYRVNVSANQGGPNLEITELELLTSITGVRRLQWKVDSVRYLKPGMLIDIYKKETSTKLYSISIDSVDKANKLITFLPSSITAATTDVNTTTNALTVPDATLYPTGTPVILATTSGMPSPLTVGTTYYSIYVDSTHIKFATSLDNALVNNPIDVTTQGAGTHYLRVSYVVTDNDELWLKDRYGKLTRFWNIDWPEPAKADWTATRPGTVSSNAVTALARSSGRMFVFTENSAQRFDGSNMVTFNNNVGCIAPGSIQNIDDDWLVWVDAKGRVWARNESSGQQEYISRGIYKLILKNATLTNLRYSSSMVDNNMYSLYLGSMDVGFGSEMIRLVYSFDDNNWVIDALGRDASFQGLDTVSNVVKPILFSSTGKVYIDDSGNTDDGTTIPLREDFGRQYLGTRRKKKIKGIIVTSRNAAGSDVRLAMDNGQLKTIGQIDTDETYIEISQRQGLPQGSRARCVIDSALDGDPQVVEGIEWEYTIEEELPTHAKR